MTTSVWELGFTYYRVLGVLTLANGHFSTLTSSPNNVIDSKITKKYILQTVSDVSAQYCKLKNTEQDEIKHNVIFRYDL